MSDIKLFQMGPDGVTELPSSSVQVESSLQRLFEQNLESLLGVRFLAHEHSTGPVHGGRIDTLGLDEDGSPVIIEYKRALNENVINQGLFYLDWLMDHRGDFTVIVQQRLGQEAASQIDWSGPRLLCIAGDFTRYDEHAVKQIVRNIELIRYRNFGDGLLMIEMVHSPRESLTGSTAQNGGAIRSGGGELPDSQDADPYMSQRISYRISQTHGPLKDLFDATYRALEQIGDDVQVREQKLYIAFNRIKNFACLQVFPQDEVVRVYVKVNPDSVMLEPGFTRDVRSVGHFGTGDLQVDLRSMADLQKALPLFATSYDRS
jgi:predicted transport protein